MFDNSSIGTFSHLSKFSAVSVEELELPSELEFLSFSFTIFLLSVAKGSNCLLMIAEIRALFRLAYCFA